MHRKLHMVKHPSGNMDEKIKWSSANELDKIAILKWRTLSVSLSEICAILKNDIAQFACFPSGAGLQCHKLKKCATLEKKGCRVCWPQWTLRRKLP